MSGTNVFDQFDDAPSPEPTARTEVVQGRPMSTTGSLPQPTESDQAVGAREAREAAASVPRRRAAVSQPTSTPTKPLAEGANVFDQFDGDPKDNGIALMERLRLNRQDAFYRGSVAGSSRLALLANTYRSEDPPDATLEIRKLNKEARDEYVKIIADLAAYDQLQPWGTTLEAAAAFGGQLEGTMISPESWIGWGAKGVTWLGRTLRAAGQQAAIQAGTDPVVQGLDIAAGAQKEYDPVRTAAAAGLGAIIGGGGHLVGEGLGKIVGQRQLRKQLFDLGAEDPAFDAPRHAIWALDPDNGIRMEAPIEPGVAPTRPETTPTRRYGEGPELGFDDVAKQHQERLAASHGAAQTKLKRLKEEGRWEAFQAEAGEDAANLLEQYGYDRKDAVDLYKHYDREPGEHPREALERAVDRWYEAEERAAMSSAWLDTEFVRDMEELDRHFQSMAERPHRAETFTDFRGRETSFEGGTYYGPRGERGEADIPFESGVPAREGGAAAEGGAPSGRPGEARGADEGGAARPDVGRPEGERAAAVPAGERLGGPREPLAAERTAQGQQTLMPGVAPITDRQRAEAGMAKPMRGGEKGMPEGGLFDEGARAQRDIFDQAPAGRDMEPQGIAKRRKGGRMDGEPERQARAQDLAAPAEVNAIRSLQQQSMDLAQALGFPLREGRVQSRKHAGQFAPRTGVVRVREVPDFDVVSHEAGHALEARLGQELTDFTKLHAAELRALDYDQTDAGRRVNEGFAEFVRLLMTNPAYAERRAPTFALEFRQFMDGRAPEVMAKIESAAAAYRAYLEAPSVDAVGSVRRSIDEDPRGLARVAQALREDGLPGVIKAVVQKSYEAVLDDKAPIARAVRELGIAIRNRQGGALVDLKAVDNPEVLARMVSRSRQAAVRDLMDGVRPYGEIAPEGPALADAISEAIGAPSVWGKWDPVKKADFSTYLIARRAALLWDKFDAGEIPNPPVAFSKADAQVAMQDLERANPNFANASDMVHAYNREVLRKAYDGGLISADRYAAAIKDEFYVPFMRDMSDKPNAGGGFEGGGEGPGTTSIIRRLRGSARDIKDPLESIMAQTFLVNRTLRHNDLVRAFARLSERAGPEGGKYVEVIPAHEIRAQVADLEQAIENRAKEIGMSPEDAQTLIAALGDPEGGPITGTYFKMEQAAARGEPIVFYREGGELKAARFMSEKEGHALYELMSAAPEPVTDLWMQMIGTAAAVKRSGIVTNPTFAITNYFRDQVAASILRSDYVPIVSGLKGIKAEFAQAQSAVLYGYAGGVAGGASTGPVEHAFRAEVDALAKKGYLVNRVTSMKGLLELSSFTEAGTRNSIFDTVFQAAKRKGLSDYEAMVEAAFQAQDLLDFSRHGSRTMLIRNLLPFLNAHMQGMDKARRTLEPLFREKVFAGDEAARRNAIGTMLKFGAAGGALGAIWAAVNSDSEAYRDANPYFKGTHLVMPWGNKIGIMPKPFELAVGFTAGEYAYHALAEKDPRAARMFAEAAWQSMSPPNPLTEIPVVSTTAELMLGKSMFTGRDIVPESMQRLPAEQQFTDRTSELAKWLGKQTGLSPIKIEYAIGAEFGTWGRDVMALSQGVNEDAPAQSLDDAVFFRRFVKDPTRSSNVTTKFWDFMGRTTGKFNQDVAGYDDLVKAAITRGRPLTEANDFLAKLPSAERAFVTLKSGARDDGKPAFNADERRLHPLQHAYDAVTLLNSLRRELSTNAQMSFGGRDRINLNPVERRNLLENVRELAQMEMRNGLVIMGEGGFAGRPVLDPADTMDKIRAISPAIADEIGTRYATAKVYSTRAVQEAWPRLRDELVRNGTQADIKGLMLDAKAQGYQFQGQRAKRPGVIRRPISGAPAAPAPNP